MVSGTETVNSEPPPPMDTGLEPPEEPMTNVVSPLTLLGSSAKPPPLPPKEMDTPCGGVICKPAPSVT